MRIICGILSAPRAPARFNSRRRFSTTMETDSTLSDLKNSILDEEDDFSIAKKPSKRPSKAYSPNDRPKPPTKWVPKPSPPRRVKTVSVKSLNEPSNFRPKSVAPNLAIHKRDQGVGLLVVYYPGEREIEIVLSNIKGPDPATRVSESLRSAWRSVELAAIIRFLTTTSPLPAAPLLEPSAPVKLDLHFQTSSNVNISLAFERTTEPGVRLTMTKGTESRTMAIDAAEETLLVEFLRASIWMSFGFLSPPKAFW